MPRRGPIPLPSPSRGTATASSGLEAVELAAPGGVVRLDAVAVDAMLTAGRLVDRPGSLPPHLLADVQSFVLALEAHLEQAGRRGHASASTRMEVTAAQVPVVGFLFQQSRLREQLPLRLLMVCTTCRLEKVVNPDLARLRERARRSQVLTSSVGMLVSGRGASPYVMLGRMAHLKKSEPDFVCPRCQGLDADECVVTFCPRCGDRRDESVLRVCPTCQHDVRQLDPTRPAWQEAAAVPPPPPPPPPPLTPPPTSVGQPAPPRGEWLPDPFGRGEARYWDGGWTALVRRDGALVQDPPGE